MREKELQHAQLMHALQVTGFDAKLMILKFGLGGTVYQQAAEDLRLLGHGGQHDVCEISHVLKIQ